jgi:hypothetical protein
MADRTMSQPDRVQTSVYFPKEVYAALVKWAEEEDRFRKRTLREQLVIWWCGWWLRRWKRRSRSEVGNGDDLLIPARSWSIKSSRIMNLIVLDFGKNLKQ